MLGIISCSYVLLLYKYKSKTGLQIKYEQNGKIQMNDIDVMNKVNVMKSNWCSQCKYSFIHAFVSSLNTQ